MLLARSRKKHEHSGFWSRKGLSLARSTSRFGDVARAAEAAIKSIVPGSMTANHNATPMVLQKPKCRTASIRGSLEISLMVPGIQAVRHGVLNESLFITDSDLDMRSLY